MFLATSLGCIHEVVQFCHIIMSIIHRVSSAKPCKCRHEVSEQDISEEIFHLVAVFGKKRFHTLGFHTQTQNFETSCTAEKTGKERKVLQRSIHWLG